MIAAFPGVREAGVFVQNNELGIAELHMLLVSESKIDETALRRHCASKLHGLQLARITAVSALPRGGQGKLERHRFADAAASQSLHR